jgi:hypothetical protein
MIMYYKLPLTANVIMIYDIINNLTKPHSLKILQPQTRVYSLIITELRREEQN